MKHYKRSYKRKSRREALVFAIEQINDLMERGAGEEYCKESHEVLDTLNSMLEQIEKHNSRELARRILAEAKTLETRKRLPDLL